jgi:hypothetical protein
MPQSWSGHFGKEKNFPPLPEFKCQTILWLLCDPKNWGNEWETGLQSCARNIPVFAAAPVSLVGKG